MAASYHQIMKDLQTGHFKGIYFLSGEESYYIDKISDYLAAHILKEEEKPFNLQVLYGRDTNIHAIITLARRFPLMASHQVIIVKEAQLLNKLEGLEHYLLNPVPTTILAFCYKHKKLDKRSKLSKLIIDKTLFFESNRLREDKIPDWITSYVNEKGYDIDQKTAWLLVDFLGTELSKIANELDKLILLLPENEQTITASIVERNTGISKDYNNFELINALTTGNVLKANQIIQYFGKNPKSNPFILTISSLFYFYSKLLLYHGTSVKSREHVSKVLGINPYFVSDYQRAARNISFKRTREVISLLREYDLKSKGVNNMAGEGDLMKELVYKIMH